MDHYLPREFCGTWVLDTMTNGLLCFINLFRQLEKTAVFLSPCPTLMDKFAVWPAATWDTKAFIGDNAMGELSISDSVYFNTDTGDVVKYDPGTFDAFYVACPKHCTTTTIGASQSAAPLPCSEDLEQTFVNLIIIAARVKAFFPFLVTLWVKKEMGAPIIAK